MDVSRLLESFIPNVIGHGTDGSCKSVGIVSLEEVNVISAVEVFTISSSFASSVLVVAVASTYPCSG
jgi:hypothetical protein